MLTIHRTVTTTSVPTERALRTAVAFGLGLDDQRRHTIIPPTHLPLPSAGIIFITGPSGSGKSSILRAVTDAAAKRDDLRTINLDTLPDPPHDQPLVDCFDLPLDETTALLARAGLGDAFIMLRTPRELSDGQRFRLRLARAMHEADHADESSSPSSSSCASRTILLADEFAATLDRLTAATLARSIRRWISRTPHTFIAATTHDDLLEPLQPDVLIHKDLGPHVELHHRDTENTEK